MSFETRLNHLDEIMSLRRALHMEPELSGEERITAKILENYFLLHPPQHLMTHLGGYGLAAIYSSEQPGPTVMIRADMDALPIQERNEVVYRSTRDGISHKCGHDGHMAIVAGLAALLKQHPPQQGRVVLLFQPAEETGQGAKAIVQDERFAQIQPDYCFALHNLPGFPLGQVMLNEGIFAAASVGMIVEFRGATAHAAYPETGLSPALAMADLIQSLQALNQVCETPADFTLVTVVSASLGEASFGISPGSANIMATLRAFDDKTLASLQATASALAERLAMQYGLVHTVLWSDDFPVTRNHPEATALIRQSALACHRDLHPKPEPLRWSEDFGWFTQQSKGAMFGLGSGPDLILHSADYDFPENLLEPGIQIFWGILQRLVYV